MSEIKVLSIIDGKTLLSLEVELPKFIVSRFFRPDCIYSPEVPKSAKAGLHCGYAIRFQRVSLCGNLKQDNAERCISLLRIRLTTCTSGYPASQRATWHNRISSPSLIPCPVR